MASNQLDQTVLVADIGGTNARFACFDLASEQLLSRHTVTVGHHPDIHAAIDSAAKALPEFSAIQAVCIAIAGPINNDWVQASNSPWAFSRKDLQTHYGWSTLLIVNDFLAAAYGAVVLSPDAYLPIGSSTLFQRKTLPSVVIGPGTGLGVAALLPGEPLPGKPLPGKEARWKGFATEGGHARLAPFDEEDIALLTLLHKRLGPVQREDVLSGRGLCNLHWVWMRLHGKELAAAVDDPAQITATAVADATSPEAQVLHRFCGILGTVAADVALDFAAWGTVYLAGGILPRIADFLQASTFRERFESHAQFGDYLRLVNTVLITEPNLGLMGAVQCLRRQMREQEARAL